MCGLCNVFVCLSGFVIFGFVYVWVCNECVCLHGVVMCVCVCVGF